MEKLKSPATSVTSSYFPPSALVLAPGGPTVEASGGYLYIYIYIHISDYEISRDIYDKAMLETLNL